jgi:hypothetical protein
MIERGIDRLARALAAPHSRRQAVHTVAAALTGVHALPAAAQHPGTDKKPRNQDRNKNKDRKKNDKKSTIPRNCERFVISAGPDKDDKFKHIDDDLFIELIPKGRNVHREVLLKDDNGLPNGDNGKHLSVKPFTAKIGDRIHIVATNAEKGGCELDEIWLHCIESKGGEMRLTKRIKPENCNGDQLGAFLNALIRIR